MDVQIVVDKLAINEALTRYATGVDRRDWKLWRTAFTEDALLDFSSVGGAVGPIEDVGRWLEETLGVVSMSQHLISNVAIDLDGDRADVVAMFFNPMQIAGVKGLSYCGGYYHHDFIRTSDGWRSEKLVEDTVWYDNIPGR